MPLPQIEYIDITKLKPSDTNPRQIKDNNFVKLKKSIKEDPLYFETRPCIVDDSTGELIIIAGCMRYRASCDLGLSKIPCIIKTLSDYERKRWTILDNTHSGHWDTDLLSTHFEIEELDNWGLDLGSIGLSLEDKGESQTETTNKPIKLSINFKTLEDRDNAESEIAELLSKNGYTGITIKSSPKN